MADWEKLVQQTRREYREAREDDPDGDTGTVAHEIADGAVPVYNADRLHLVLDNMHLGCAADPIGDAEDAFALLGNVIYDELYQACMEEEALIEEERRDDPD